MTTETQKKADTRFRYNQGVYQIRLFDGHNWQPCGPEIGGSFAKCTEKMKDYQRSDPETPYALFFLQECDERGSIQWVKASTDTYYFHDNREQLMRILKKLQLPMNDAGYSTLAKITNISKNSIVNWIRQPEDPRYQALSNEGLLYIRYRVQETLLQREQHV